ncbi:digalactosyldiacylglycerol synthase 2, chloroplastic [Gossypium australe]|uniref:Digalactosyldiacylglycerol synthase 2, chloroplastic n=1 Tax=Gossypium australe TaxID=47621 RepID=A0A5B6W0Q4_9ROSI|nr:digalactosyldiacylglycerol synthase 2, chloroplastic [Gossypium australe]
MDRKQHIAIFTTASLPWMTGTAVNPLFRAAYLAKDGERKVTLVIPWLSLKDQKLVYPNNTTFGSPSEQELFIRQWLEERTAFISGFAIRFYPGKRWKTKFRLVIGIIHTNYLEYVKREKNGKFQAFLLKYVNSWVVSIYCHKKNRGRVGREKKAEFPCLHVIRLSAATQDYPRSIICNVHGVNPKFLEIGKERFEQQHSSNHQAFTKGAYYIGKMIWNKGYGELLKLLNDHQKELAGLEIDLYGNGEDSDQVKEAANKLKLTVRVHPGRDHADPLFHDYKVFLNPSTTDVVCTTTAEALAMGKIVVCANHPSNDFFKQFPNCRIYDDDNGFVEATCKALSEEPVPLTDAQRYELSWEAATERFLKVSELNQVFATEREKNSSKEFASVSLNLWKSMEDTSAYFHYLALGFETTRRAFGAIPGSLQPDEEQRKELGLATSSKHSL